MQKDALQKLTGRIEAVTDSGLAGLFSAGSAEGVLKAFGSVNNINEVAVGRGYRAAGFEIDSSLICRSATETRPSNVALAPRIYR